jgi:hypothetical protein
MRSISSLARPLDGMICIACCRLVALSRALTFRMPLASMSNVTSICGTPRGAGGMPSKDEAAQALVVGGHRALALHDVDLHLRLPVGGGGKDLAASWLGMVVLRSISGVATPPSVSMPSVSGVTSSSTTSFTSPPSTPA